MSYTVFAENIAYYSSIISISQKLSKRTFSRSHFKKIPFISGNQSSRELDQQRAIKLQKDAFNAQVEGRKSDAILLYKKLLKTKFVAVSDENHPGFRIKYAALKNISRILPPEDDSQG